MEFELQIVPVVLQIALLQRFTAAGAMGQQHFGAMTVEEFKRFLGDRGCLGNQQGITAGMILDDHGVVLFLENRGTVAETNGFNHGCARIPDGQFTPNDPAKTPAV